MTGPSQLEIQMRDALVAALKTVHHHNCSKRVVAAQMRAAIANYKETYETPVAMDPLPLRTQNP